MMNKIKSKKTNAPVMMSRNQKIRIFIITKLHSSFHRITRSILMSFSASNDIIIDRVMCTYWSSYESSIFQIGVMSGFISQYTCRFPKKTLRKCKFSHFLVKYDKIVVHSIVAREQMRHCLNITLFDHFEFQAPVITKIVILKSLLK